MCSCDCSCDCFCNCSCDEFLNSLKLFELVKTYFDSKVRYSSKRDYESNFSSFFSATETASSSSRALVRYYGMRSEERSKEVCTVASRDNETFGA